MDRLFIALPLNREIIDKITPAIERLGSYKKILKPVSPSQMHITVKFIGQVQKETTDTIIRELPSVIQGHAPVGYEVSGFGAFPSLAKASVIWCGIKTDINALRALHRDIETAMYKKGIEKETRAFRPHITLGRLRKGRQLPPRLLSYLQENRKAAFGTGIFDTVTLFKSDLTPEGPQYTELLTIPLD